MDRAGLRTQLFINNLINMYGISLDDQYLKFKDVIIPNFFKLNLTSINQKSYLDFEFAHSLNKILYYSNYKTFNLSWYETNSVKINADDIVFDLGGNFGIFAAYAATKAKQVYCFEPMSLIRNYLEKVKEIYPNIIIVPYAAGETERTEKFLQMDNPAASSDLKHQNLVHEVFYTEQVNVIDLDSFCLKNNIRPSFIKADIEGSEIEMLEGARTIINQFHPSLSISVHGRDIQKYKDEINNVAKDYFILTKGHRAESDVIIAKYDKY